MKNGAKNNKAATDESNKQMNAAKDRLANKQKILKELRAKLNLLKKITKSKSFKNHKKQILNTENTEIFAI